MRNALSTRAAALRDFELLPDDALVGFDDIALLEGRNGSAVRQAYYQGRLGLSRVPGVGRCVMFRVGAVRARLRGEAIRASDTEVAP